MSKQIVPILKTWMQLATVDEQLLLAQRCETSRTYLYHLSGGFRKASPELAAAIERESKAMHRASNGRLPIVYRTDLSPVCRACEFAQKCLGTDVTVRGSFEPVTAEDLA